jgi:hypothetical protein
VVNTSGCGPEDRGFDPLRSPHCVAVFARMGGVLGFAAGLRDRDGRYSGVPASAVCCTGRYRSARLKQFPSRARSSVDRASGFEPEGRGFESLRACHSYSKRKPRMFCRALFFVLGTYSHLSPLSSTFRLSVSAPCENAAVKAAAAACWSPGATCE